MSRDVVAPKAAVAVRGVTPSAAATGSGDARGAGLLALQRLAGNQAVVRLLAIQRHNSSEHALMADTQPKQLDEISSSMLGKAHAVEDEQARMTFFQHNPKLDPRDRFPDVRWIQLKGSNLWVSSGEITALADYLPDPGTIDSAPESIILPVLQKMRHEISKSLTPLVAKPAEGGFEGEASSFVDKVPKVPADAKAINDVDTATADLGQNRQQGLLARNACHFAPYSWERWALHHKQARLEASKHFSVAQGTMGTGGGMLEHERKAWVNNGYANHFLQDSFAAGHLINKTLVMQWFLEYLAEHHDTGRLADPAVAKDMSESAQPGLAHRNLYKSHRLDISDEEDRASGTSAVDPQTNEERRTGAGRLAGSGVVDTGRGRAFAYHEYGELLDSSYANMSANNTHDFLNHLSLIVGNERNDKFKIGGDGTFLTLSNDEGIRLPIEADQLADRAITEILTTGSTGVKQEEIFKYFPTRVEGYGTMWALETWNDIVLRNLCHDIIFPRLEDLSMKILRAIHPRLVENPEGSALDLPTAP